MTELKQGDVTIYLGSGQSHLKMLKANVLVILGKGSDISLGQNCWNLLLQNHWEESSLVGAVTAVLFNVLGT